MRYFLTLILFISYLFSNQPDAVMKIEKEVDQRATITIVGAKDIPLKFKKEINRLFKADFSISGHFLV